MVVSVRRAWPSLWYCLTLDFLYSTWSDGTTPSVNTRVRKLPGRAARDAPIEDQLHLIGTADVEILADDFFEETAARSAGRSRTWVNANSACRIER